MGGTHGRSLFSTILYGRFHGFLPRIRRNFFHVQVLASLIASCRDLRFRGRYSSAGPAMSRRLRWAWHCVYTHFLRIRAVSHDHQYITLCGGRLGSGYADIVDAHHHAPEPGGFRLCVMIPIRIFGPDCGKSDRHEGVPIELA